MKRKIAPAAPRGYRQTARAETAEATAHRIVEAFSESMRTKWFDEITLEEVASLAGVTVRTVLRRFGDKDGLLKAFVENFVPSVGMSRTTPAGDVAAAIESIVDVYESWGDSVIRNLAQEQRHPALKPLLDLGRGRHRAITAEVYAPWLDRLAGPDRQTMLDALVAATDVYTWKLARRDMGRTRKETGIILRRLVDAVLAQAATLASESGNEQ